MTVRPELIGKEMRIAGPGQKLEDVPLRQLDTHTQVPTIRYEQTELGGAYRVQFPEEPSANFRFAVQADPTESAMRELSSSDLESFSQVTPVIRWTPGADLRAKIQHERTGTELWLPILLGVIGLILAETVFGNRWSRSR